MLIGYARVSTIDQNPALQMDALKTADCDKVFTEKASGSHRDRLALIDAKTGPRHVLLGEAARELLQGLVVSASGEWVFPGRSEDDR